MTTLLTPPLPAPFPDGEHGYPVVGSAVLEPVRRRFLRGYERHPDELPEEPPGTVLVFHANGEYQLAPSGPGRLRSSVVIHASSVLVVSTRQEIVAVRAPLSSVTRSKNVLCVLFHCRVTDPVLVLEAGAHDVRPALMRAVLADDQLQMLASRDDVYTDREVARRLLARFLASTPLNPPNFPGLSTAVLGVQLRLESSSDDHWQLTENPAGQIGAHDNGYGRPEDVRGSGRPPADDDFGDDPPSYSTDFYRSNDA